MTIPEDQPTVPIPTELYNAWVERYFHQNGLMWSRVNWLIVVESAIIAGTFAKPGAPACILLVVGSSLIVILGLMMMRDRQDREDARKGLMASFHKQHGLDSIDVLSVAKPRFLTGTVLQLAAFVVLFVLNAALFFLSWFHELATPPEITSLDSLLDVLFLPRAVPTPEQALPNAPRPNPVGVGKPALALGVIGIVVFGLVLLAWAVMTAYISHHIREEVPGKRLLLDRLFHGFSIGVAMLAVLTAGVAGLLSSDAFTIVFIATLTALGIKIYSEAHARS